MRRVQRQAIVSLVAVAVPSLAGATAVVAVLQSTVGVPNASSVYLLAVVATAFVGGRVGAVVASSRMARQPSRVGKACHSPGLDSTSALVSSAP